MDIRGMSIEQLREESFIDVAFAILENGKQTLTLQELSKEIQKVNEMTDQEIKDRMLQFYTDMNVDGRFLAIEGNRWGLREWYPVDQIEEETAPTVKVRKKKAKVVADDDLEDDSDDDEIGFDEDFDEFVEDLDDDEEEDFDLDPADEEEDETEEIEVVDADELLEADDELEIVEDDEEEDEE
ncbi:DNA-directed RNA polymerase subunit delta [Paenisporosarcina cavernae]|uniref:Probable DNA-directed RNA polymerase subunit delta n=1 Tax=Paenisporosarcina cavernae TaxID=2320858 RepID=A0A385YPZ4_9BACL|nr:DNA-directed RNA polymerase subunit delta [Paenisporosarcina cavernae]AYC28805.1 DNA-directed RNA polymerase subunit delta [Paenisporosarcina cavernae]